jgi:hypothetical protein
MDKPSFRKPGGHHNHEGRSLKEDLASATGPMVLMCSEMPEGSQEKTLVFAIWFFGAFAALGTFVILQKEGFTPAIACPWAIPALLTILLFVNRRAAEKLQLSTAASLLSDEQDNVISAIQRFQAKTDAPLHIVIRDHIPNIQSSARELFERLEKERVIDSRGVLFVFSARSAGFAITIGEALARKGPKVESLIFSTMGLSKERLAKPLITCLDAFATEVGRLFPQQEAPRRSPADVLDIQA